MKDKDWEEGAKEDSEGEEEQPVANLDLNESKSEAMWEKVKVKRKIGRQIQGAQSVRKARTKVLFQIWT